MTEERDLSDAYRWTTGDNEELKPQGRGLNDLFLRFFRVAERCIVGQNPWQGVICFITNNSWLDGLSYPIMRQRFLKELDAVWIDNLNGDKYRTGKLTPEGNSDPSVFSTEQNREGIQVGTAIALLVRVGRQNRKISRVKYRDLWGLTKRSDLLASLGKIRSRKLYEDVVPVGSLGLPFRPTGTEPTYFSWPMVPDLFPFCSPGVQTSRDELLVSIDRDRLMSRLNQYFDASLQNVALATILPAAMRRTGRFDPIETRRVLLRKGLTASGVIRYVYRPFDVRWLYWESETKLLDEKRSEYYRHLMPENLWLVSQQKTRKTWSRPQCIRSMADLVLMDRGASCFPLFVSQSENRSLYGDEHNGLRKKCDSILFNLSDRALHYLETVDSIGERELLFFHTLACLHAPSYDKDNSGALLQDWPRMPLPSRQDALQSSAALGRQVAALLDTETAVPGITAGRIRPELKVIAVTARVGGGHLNPAAGELDVTARWGIAGKGGITMPGKGRLTERAYTEDERTAFVQGAAALSLDAATVMTCLGETTCDVYLNDTAYWRNVPAQVWHFTLGGYQVVKKWLSYREKTLLGRGLTLDEMSYVSQMVRRIAALLLLRPALDANYQAVKAALYPWPGSAAAGADSGPLHRPG